MLVAQSSDSSQPHGLWFTRLLCPWTRILEWVAIPFSRASSQPQDRTLVSRIAGQFFTIWATRKALFFFNIKYSNLELLCGGMMGIQWRVQIFTWTGHGVLTNAYIHLCNSPCCQDIDCFHHPWKSSCTLSRLVCSCPPPATPRPQATTLLISS